MGLTGKSLLGFGTAGEAADTFRAIDPSSGMLLKPDFVEATVSEVERVAGLATEAFHAYSRVSGSVRAQFLRTVVKRIEQCGESLVSRAVAETGLAPDRIRSERARPLNQLLLFAELVEEGSWVDARIDSADPTRKPFPTPDVRSMLRPIGPVVVFAASNFPLAFSVAGGDTASALAGGNPVIVKAHSAHPGTSEMIGRAVIEAVRDCGLPEGTFSLLFGAGVRVGSALVRHPAIKAAGFTGSRIAGTELFKLATARPEPIPFFAEMSSTNPVLILSSAISERCEDIADGLHASITTGAGQFCTKPGLIFLQHSPLGDQFLASLADRFRQTEYVLLTSAIHAAYQAAGGTRSESVSVLSRGKPSSNGGFRAEHFLFETDGKCFLANSNLQAEVFGPSALVVRYSQREELTRIVGSLEGQLTATVHGTDDELKEHMDVLAILQERAGRIIMNRFPTGVEVGHAIVHGGPHPSTSDVRFSRWEHDQFSGLYVPHVFRISRIASCPRSCKR